MPPDMPFSFITHIAYLGLSAGKNPANQQYRISLPFSSYCPLCAVAVLEQQVYREENARFPVPSMVVRDKASFRILHVFSDKTLVPSFPDKGERAPFLSVYP